MSITKEQVQNDIFELFVHDSWSDVENVASTDKAYIKNIENTVGQMWRVVEQGTMKVDGKSSRLSVEEFGALTTILIPIIKRLQKDGLSHEDVRLELEWSAIGFIDNALEEVI